MSRSSVVSLISLVSLLDPTDQSDRTDQTDLKSGRASLHEPHFDRQLARQTGKTNLGLLFGHSAKFVQDRARLNDRGPEFRLPFAFSHPSFQRRAGHRLIRENANVKLSFAANVLLRSDTSGFDRRGFDPTGFK